MKFGTFHLMERPFNKGEAQVIREHMEQIKLADRIGFDAVWLTEHHFSSVPYVPEVLGEYGLSTSPFALACAVSQITERVRIGTAVKVLPIDHPLRVAEEVTFADILSNGRIDVGVGTGYRSYEFEGFDISIDEKLARFKEALEIMTGAWTTEEYSYDGKFWKVPRLTLVPRPIQQPHPPVWIATRLGTRETIDFAVENGYRLLSAWAPPNELRATRDLMREVRAEQGQGGDFDFPCIRHMFVAENDTEARRLGVEYIEYYMKSTALFRPIGKHERDEMVFGGVDTCIEKLRRLRAEGGVNYVLGWMNFGGMPDELVQGSMRLFAEEVMPKLRDDTEADAAD